MQEYLTQELNKQKENNMEYKTLTTNKTYDEMTLEEFEFCVAKEIEHYKDKENNYE